MLVEVKLSRISTIGITAGLAYIALGIAYAALNPTYHMPLLGLGAGILFPASVYMTFTGSLKSGSPRRGLEALIAWLTLVASLATPLVGVYSLEAGLVLSLASVSLLGVHVYFQVAGWRRKESRLLLFYPVLSGILGIIASLSRSNGFIEPLAMAGASVAIPMIYVVSLTTVSRNYGFDPSRPVVHAPFIVFMPSIALYMSGYTSLSLACMGVSMLVYHVTLGLHRLRLPLDRASRGPPILASTLKYMITAHILSLGSAIGLLYSSYTGGLLVAIHYIYIGFIGLHILLHAPLMLPQITGLVLRKDYKPTPLILLFLAAVLRGVHGEASLLLVASALVIAGIQFRPVGFVHRIKKG